MSNLLLFREVTRLAIYVRDTIRSSTSASTQEVGLRELAAELGYQPIRVFRDASSRHARAREPRKGLSALMHAVRSGHIDMVAIWSLPVVGGSPTALGKFLVSLRDAGVRLLVHDPDPEQAIAAGTALVAAGSHLADLGRAERRRRTLDGQARVALAGKHIGRPRVPDDRIEKVRAALADGAGIRAAARIGGVSPASALRIAKLERRGVAENRN